MDQGVRPAPSVEQEPLENGESGESLQPGCGMLELHPNGYGFLRSPANNYDRVRSDPFVPGTMIERCDACGRFESDDAARQKLVELGLL